MQKGTQLSSEEKYRLLRDISFKIKDTFDLDIILNHLLDTLKTVMEYDAAGIFILSKQITDLHYKFPGQKISGIARRGYKRAPQTDEMLVEGKGIIGYVIKTGESLIIDDVRNDTRYVVGRKQSLSEITVPILINNKAVGALDVESDTTSAFCETDLDLLKFFAEASAISIEKAILHQQLLQKEKLEEQLQIAKNVQSSLLPSDPPKLSGYDIDAVCIPTFEIGGDYFDYIRIDENKIGLVVADVSGDGVPAALIMAAFRALLRNQIRIVQEPHIVMNYLNKQVSGFCRKRDFITAFYGCINLKEHIFTYTNCGHNHPIVMDSSGKIDFLDKNGPSLNIVKNADYKSFSIKLNEGESVIFYTDGVTEIFNDIKEEYGLERLKQVLKCSSEESASGIIKNVISATKDFSKHDYYLDDFTIMVLKRNKINQE